MLIYEGIIYCIPIYKNRHFLISNDNGLNTGIWQNQFWKNGLKRLIK